MTLKPLLALITAAAFAAEAPVHTMGAANAPITIELFSDFQCPGCKELHETILRDLRRTYVATGKVRLVYRDIHLPMHKYARLAACYACAAEKLGMYDQVADKLFETQSQWDRTGKVDDALAGVVPAPQMLKLRAIAADPATGHQVDSTTQDAVKTGVSGTPTMLIRHGGKTNLIPLVSAPVLSRYLDMLLAQ